MAQESHRAGLPALWGAVRLFDGFLKIRFEFHMVENMAFIAEANVSYGGSVAQKRNLWHHRNPF